MKRLFEALLFFIGWVLSPFTWWNDAFVNIPLSYLMASTVYRIIKVPFKLLVIGSYWLTNAIGIFFMYTGGRKLIVSTKNKKKTTIMLIIFTIVYSAVMLYLDKQGKLVPLGNFFARFCVKR